jgi:glycogen synthase
MRILIATDAFPPTCGGSGWSTYELAKGLRARGHEIVIVRPRVGSRPAAGGSTEQDPPYDDFHLIEIPAWAPRVPFLRNYFKNERLYTTLRNPLAAIIRERRIDIVHAQHVLTGPSSIVAAHAAGVPVVCTVRDYWPVCYWSDLIHDRSADSLCPQCSTTGMTRCLRPHAGALWPMALPMIPYMQSNLALKRRTLAEADAVIAVSRAIARDLRARAPELSGTRIETIHNPVDVAGIRAQGEREPRPHAEPYALFVGKLEPNKGVAKLLTAIERARLEWPLVVIGEGSERPRLEAAARAAGRPVQFRGWRPREDVLVWLRHAGMLIFPSHGPESLSRVLLEASVLGVPIAAMDTGGTSDIIINNETGLLSRSVEELGEHVAQLRRDPALRERLGEAARRRAETIFDAPTVVARIERLYAELVSSS